MLQLDTIIVGAGLAGIGAAVHLMRQFPGQRLAILEARGTLGGTWDLFRYPGVRSDSDMHTLGYRFAPWPHPDTVAEGEAIRQYIHDVAHQHGVWPLVRLHHRVTAAAWCSQQCRWTLSVDRGEASPPLTLHCRFLLLCTGYFRYDAGHQPALPGADQFQGRIVHPQHWPQGLHTAGQRVVVIGSGATAITLVPALAEQVGQDGAVTLLQRSPSYIVGLPRRDRPAAWLQQALPAPAAARLTRWKNILRSHLDYQAARRFPAVTRRRMLQGVHRAMGGLDDQQAGHFAPRYAPWDQRVCFTPDDAFFAALRSGRASIRTDQIKQLTPNGIALTSGAHLRADLIVTATGLDLLALGGIALSVDGEAVDVGRRFSYRGMMLAGVPNLAYTFGYTHTSWTLKAELTAQRVCAILQHMDRTGAQQCTPQPPAGLRRGPYRGLTAGYVLRAARQFPPGGDQGPWRSTHSYLADAFASLEPVDDGTLRFTPAPR